ncbi:MAG: hypothetical protein EZS28_046124, partial [Streblomastix strix]
MEKQALLSRAQSIAAIIQQHIVSFYTTLKERFEKALPLLKAEEIDELQNAYKQLTESNNAGKAQQMCNAINAVTNENRGDYIRSLDILERDEMKIFNSSMSQLTKVLQNYNERESKLLIRHDIIQNIAKEINPLLKIDIAVEEILMEEAEDFINSVIRSASLVASHRNS